MKSTEYSNGIRLMMGADCNGDDDDFADHRHHHYGVVGANVFILAWQQSQS